MTDAHEDDDAPPTDFGSIFNWCDRHCERCPQRMRCAIPRTIGERDLDAFEKTDEPEPEEASPEEIRAKLDELMQMLRDEIGDDPNEPIQLDSARMAHLGRDIGMALHDHPVPFMSQLALTVMMKTARLSYVFEREIIEDGIWMLDTAPNILLLQRTAAELDAKLEALPESDPHRGPIRILLARLLEIYAPLEERLAPSRVLLAGWIARGEAPSPWLLETLVAAND